MQASTAAVGFYQSFDGYFFHKFGPLPVNSIEVSEIFQTLFPNIGTRKYVLQVQPISLTFFPLLQSFTHNDQAFLQLLNVLGQSLDVPISLNVTYFGKRLVEQYLDAVDSSKFVGFLILVLYHFEFLNVPKVLYLCQLVE